MKRGLLIAIAGVISGLGAMGSAQSPGRTHELPLAAPHVHWGHYDARVKPVLRIAPGDRVRIETMVARGVERLKMAGVRDDEIPASMHAVEAAVNDRGPGPHPMTGPIYVEGAEPGDVLEVRFVTIEFLHPFGVAAFSPGSGVLPADFAYAHQQLLRWPAGATSVQFRPGVRLRLAPFFGSIGVAQHLCDRHIIGRQRHVSVSANRRVAGMHPGHQRRPRWRADRAAGVVLSEADALRGQTIERRRDEARLPVCAEIAISKIVGLNQQDVRRQRFLLAVGRDAASESGNHDDQRHTQC